MARVCMVAYSEYVSDARIRREAEALAARGDTVDCVCSSMEGGVTPATLNGVRLLAVATRKYRGSSTRRYMGSYLRFFLQATILVSRAHLRRRYDVVQVHTMPDFMVFTALPARLMGAKVLLDIHDLVPELYMSKFGMVRSHPLIRMLVLVERVSVAFADRAIAVHQTHLDALVGHRNPRDKFSILLNCPDPTIFVRRRDSRRNGAFTLVYHGTVSRRHGLELALRAIGQLRGKIPDLRFDVIGGGDDLDRIVALSVELGLGAAVNFKPGVPVHELPALLESADVGVVPLKVDSFTRYMLPVKLMEYVEMGIPTIVTRTATVEWYFDDDMVEYITGDSADELASKILGLYADPSRRALIARNAQRFAAVYSWDKQRGQYYALVDSLVGSRGRRPARSPVRDE